MRNPKNIETRLSDRTRRAFLADAARGGVAASLALAFPARGWGMSAIRATEQLVGFDAPVTQLMDPAGVRALALRAIDAARSAGASYADVRLTRNITQAFSVVSQGRWYANSPWGTGTHDFPPNAWPLPEVMDDEQFAVGVRTLVDGCWGFAASPFWVTEDMTTLAVDAVRQAKANSRATPRRVELAATPVVTGAWRPAGVIDPFSIPPEEKVEALRAAADLAALHDIPRGRGYDGASYAIAAFAFTRQERALATSDGTYCTQEFYTADTRMYAGVSMNTILNEEGKSISTRYVTTYQGLVGQGWEYFDSGRMLRSLNETLDASVFAPNPRVKPVDVGRYDVVVSGTMAARLVEESFAASTELDRAFGYEANASGTSFLSEPLDMVGTYEIGSPLLTITGNRSVPGHLATVKWDDEGVAPRDTPLITDGVVTDFQTTRESASWLSNYYGKQGHRVQSNGSAGSADGTGIPLTHTPNLVMQPGKESVDFDAMVRDTRKGLAIIDGRVSMDFQQRNGICIPRGWFRTEDDRIPQVYEIVNGKLGDAVQNAGLLFDVTKFWKSLVAIGGAQTVQTVSGLSVKGEPSQTTNHTVSAVPFKVRDAAIVDMARRQ